MLISYLDFFFLGASLLLYSDFIPIDFRKRSYSFSSTMFSFSSEFTKANSRPACKSPILRCVLSPSLKSAALTAPAFLKSIFRKSYFPEILHVTIHFLKSQISCFYNFVSKSFCRDSFHCERLPSNTCRFTQSVFPGSRQLLSKNIYFSENFQARSLMKRRIQATLMSLLPSLSMRSKLQLISIFSVQRKLMNFPIAEFSIEQVSQRFWVIPKQAAAALNSEVVIFPLRSSSTMETILLTAQSVKLGNSPVIVCANLLVYRNPQQLTSSMAKISQKLSPIYCSCLQSSCRRWCASQEGSQEEVNWSLGREACRKRNRSCCCSSFRMLSLRVFILRRYQSRFQFYIIKMSDKTYMLDNLAKLSPALTFLRRKDYNLALNFVQNKIQRFSQISPDWARKTLLIEACSLRGLVLTKLCRYQQAEKQLDTVLSVQPTHEGTLLRKIQLNLKLGKGIQALQSLKILCIVNPSVADNQQIFEQFQEAADKLNDDEKNALKKQLEQLASVDYEQEDQKCCSFLGLRSIQKGSASRSSRRKMVDFGDDQLKEFQKQEWQLQRQELPQLDLQKIKKQNQFLQDLLKDDQVEQSERLVYNTNDKTRSILLNSNSKSEVHSNFNSSVFAFSFEISKIKNIEGKVRSGKSMFRMVAEQEHSKSVYQPKVSQKSIIKTGSLKASTMSQVKQPSLVKVFNIDGKSNLPRIKKAYTEKSQEQVLHPLREQTPQQRSERKSVLKESTRSIMKSKCSGVRKSVSIKEDS